MENHGSFHTPFSPKRPKLLRTQREFDKKGAQSGWSYLMQRETEKMGQCIGESTVTNGTGRIAWLLLLVQQPDGNTLKSVGGECFTSRRVLRTFIPQGPAESL